MKIMKTGVGLLSVIALYYILPLKFRSLWHPDETRYAEISREMLVNGDWTVPHLLNLRYFEKPVAGYWINNLSQMVFGHNNFAVHFGSTFSIALTAQLVYWLVQCLWQDKKVALMAVAIFTSSLLVYGIGTYAVLDPMITLWLAAAMCSFWQASNAPVGGRKALGYLLLGVTCGLGFMTKGFLALVVPVLSIMPWAFIHRRWKEILFYGPLAVLSATAISLPWVINIAQREPDFWHYFFWVEHIQRLAEKDAQHKAPFWYYLPVLLVGALPWVALLPGSLWRAWHERKRQSGAFYILGWVVMPFLFFSIAKGKLLTYILPCFAPLAILMARHATSLTVLGARTLKVNSWINLVFGLLCALLVAAVLAPCGVTKYSLFSSDETCKVILCILGFLMWSAIGLYTLRTPVTRWQWAALCPLGIALLMSYVIPKRVIDAKQPQEFIHTVRQQLENSSFILSNSVGVAAGLAWELKRSDIYMFNCQGELEYGLNYPDAANHFITHSALSSWLESRLKEGNVSLLLLLSSCKSQMIKDIPMADEIFQRGRFVLLEYYQRP